jgi:hypothetical protein
MYRFAIAAIVSCLVASVSMAQQGPIQGVAESGCHGCGQAATGGCNKCDSRYGMNPLIKRLMFWKSDTPCGSCGLKAGCFGKNCAGQAGPNGADFNPYPNGVPGTLVFPYNPYIRSPRDWYMSER